MQKILILLTVAAALACNNDSDSRSDRGERSDRSDREARSTQTANGLPRDSLSRVATFSFIDGCMENARLTLGQEKAYAFCKCIYNQIKNENPDADSVEIESLAQDTARVAKMAEECRN